MIASVSECERRDHAMNDLPAECTYLWLAKETTKKV